MIFNAMLHRNTLNTSLAKFSSNSFRKEKSQLILKKRPSISKSKVFRLTLFRSKPPKTHSRIVHSLQALEATHNTRDHKQQHPLKKVPLPDHHVKNHLTRLRRVRNYLRDLLSERRNLLVILNVKLL